MTITLFVGDCTEYLATKAKSFDKSAYLIDSFNYKKFLNQTYIDIAVYTSFADLPKISQTRNIFYEVLKKADHIHYCPPGVWSDYDPEFTLQNQQQMTEYFLYLIDAEKNNVVGLDLSKYLSTPYTNLRSCRDSDQSSQLWVAGCSITAGVGVEDDQKFSNLIAQTFFKGKFLDLSKSASSLSYATDQILRSDIRPGDFVLWGLTSEYRAPFWNRKFGQCESINPYKFDYKRTNRADDIVDETRLYQATVSFYQVANFCEKIGAKLIAVPIICSEALQLILHNNSNYYQIPYMTNYLDVGTDGEHPGPKHHRWLSDQIHQFISTWD
jgi:hypothetical protein